ncbi:arsenate reductase (glutaredoxin) [Alkalimonas collagenimarina]|uniref:Arsenate reductase n=1 Tax=Alkalimonas collagenimarina TaxID=400390 RepID=A0ABT9H066_9GAMM|nr:arsenate reductase (glutaredoxin) [Alkalimonas collagenimarina]MDP4536702.1 arsenate reductase (glutaredoxin) [Alkalimonas collagenimarina]
MLTIYHNPRCSKSRQALEILQQHSLDITVVEYLKQPLSPAELEALLAKLGMTPRQLLRTGEQDYKDLQLSQTTKSDQQLIAAMSQYPKLMERPIVVRGDKAVVGRPPERVLELLA